MNHQYRPAWKWTYRGTWIVIGLLALGCFADPEEEGGNTEENQVNGTTNQGEITELGGSITEDQTWSGTIDVVSDVTVRNGATITIAAGTTFIMAPDSKIEFGWNGHEYTLFAEGTEDEPIVFEGREQTPGFWRNVIIGPNGTSNGYFRHVEIHDAGGGDEALVHSAPSTLAHVTIIESGSDGVRASDFKDDSQGLVVEGANGAPLILTSPGAWDRMPLEGSDLTGNANPHVIIAFSRLNEDVDAGNPGIPYYLAEGLSGRDSATFSVAAGARFIAAVDRHVEFGWNGHEFNIALNGTESDPIIFESETGESGSWQGIEVNGNVRSNSSIEHTIIRDGGGNDGQGLLIESGITVKNLTLENSLGTGLVLGASGLHSDSEIINIQDTQGLAARADFDGVITLPPGTYSGNDENFVAIEQYLTNSGTLIDVGAPYLITSSTTTRDGAELTIDAGVEIFFDVDSGLEFGWNGHAATVIAEGTSSDPIVFAGLETEAGFWEGITVGSNVAGNSVFDYVEFHDADTALYLRTAIDVTKCHFAEYQTAAMNIPGDADLNTYQSNNTFDGSGTMDIIQ